MNPFDPTQIDPNKTYTVRFNRSRVFEGELDDSFELGPLEEIGEDGPHELEMTGAQLLDMQAGRSPGFTPRDERLIAEPDGTIVQRESIVPPDDAG